jgi:hypothetical protein
MISAYLLNDQAPTNQATNPCKQRAFCLCVQCTRNNVTFYVSTGWRASLEEAMGFGYKVFQINVCLPMVCRVRTESVANFLTPVVRISL